MTLALVERDPTPTELLKLRLLLSTFQDGTGMLVNKKRPSMTLPGWRDFERVVALAFEGQTPPGGEGKNIFDVLLTDEANPGMYYGLSCKMRRELNRVQRDGRVTLELSNSAGEFWRALRKKHINQSNYRQKATEVGETFINLLSQWHLAESVEGRGKVEISKSFYLVLLWNEVGKYQLYKFSLGLPDPADLRWYFPTKKQNKIDVESNHLNGDDNRGTLFEWYGESGGQLKYYPLAQDALWSSPIFELEPLSDIEYGVIAKATAYFPNLFPR